MTGAADAGDDEPPEGAARQSLGLHLGLFVATCFTTAWAGASYIHPGATWGEIWSRLAEGIPFAASLLAILITHEMGHYVLARIHRVDVSLPYFIPLPFFGMMGTLGAVIRMRGQIRRRNALADIGAAGPLAGLVVAIPVLLFGLHLSEIGPVGTGMLEGNSLLYASLKWLSKGQWLPGGGLDVRLHGVAWAGWVGLLVTMINLLPIGQLDGGHIAFAYFGSQHNRTSRWLHRGLVPLALGASAYTVVELWQRVDLSLAVKLGATAGLPWLVWWLLLQLMRRATGGLYHPPVDEAPLSRGRRWLCGAMLGVFLLILTPIPLRLTVGEDFVRELTAARTKASAASVARPAASASQPASRPRRAP